MFSALCRGRFIIRLRGELAPRPSAPAQEGARTIRLTCKVSFAAEDQIVLASAGTSVRRQAARRQASQLAGALDWHALAEKLRARRLLPTLGPRIVELTHGQASEDFTAAVRRSIDAGRLQAAPLVLVSKRVTAALADAGISSTALKGPLLGEAIYGDPARRLSGDIDLLVDPTQLTRAVEVVRELGYSAPGDHVERDGLPLLHFALVHERMELPTVELHWRVHWYERNFARERLLAPLEQATEDWRPAPVDELAALLLFYARDGFMGLRLATDLSAWWDAFGAELRPGALGELLRCFPALARVLVVASSVAEKVVGLPAAEIIGARPRLAPREFLAGRLANPNPRGSDAQVFADMGLIDGLLAPAGGFFAFLKRQVILPREVLQRRASGAGEPRASSPLGHSARVLARYVLAMTRVLRATPMRLPAT
jgi:Uncharacterised nucleotidyltransferase